MLSILDSFIRPHERKTLICPRNLALGAAISLVMFVRFIGRVAGSAFDPINSRFDKVSFLLQARLRARLLQSFAVVAVTMLSSSTLAEFRHDSDISLRLDDTDDRAMREQYRLRTSPSFVFDDNWSVHAFLATGDEFSSAYNTFGNNGELNVRRLFGRYSVGKNRIEFGAIPPFKGRVSSTGLSKEGWVRGIRSVFETSKGELEIVAGNLDDIEAKNALRGDLSLSYVELEYSGRLSETLSYELGAERIFEENYLRSELRVVSGRGIEYTGEIVRNLTTPSTKIMLSADVAKRHNDNAIDWITYYSYVPDAFGRRAELIEDFLGFGHAIATEVKYKFGHSQRVALFAAIEKGEIRGRAQIGIEISFER